MPTFLECTVPHIVYRRGEKIHNHAVNIGSMPQAY